MKKLLFITLTSLSFISCKDNVEVSIVDCKQEHEDAVMEIAFQDVELFFLGYAAIPLTMRDQVDAANKQQMLSDFAEPLKYKKVLLDSDGSVIAFVIFFKAREQSLESVRKVLAQQVPDQTFTDEQLLAMNPDLKQTEEECGYFVYLESLAVSKDYRGNGHGRRLIKTVFEECEQKWPEIVSVIKLNVNDANSIPQKLYESEGFVRTKAQPLAAMKIVQYEKSLK